MNLTLLLDLDDTLLGNDMRSFLPAYLSSLSKNFSQWPRDLFINQLISATQVMIDKNEPQWTLEQVFDQVFYPSLGVVKSDLIETLTRFYDQEFGSLEQYTQRRPEAVRLVECAIEKGCTVVIATNPIFPRTAILQRLKWAGFPDDYPFALITSFERFHFAKPNPAYYAEILAQLGCPDQPAVMIGDSYRDDLQPAAQLGIPGYLITEKPVSLPQDLAVPIQQGPLKGVWNWIHQHGDETGKPAPVGSSQAILATARATPAALETTCGDLTPEQWTFKPSDKEWAVTEILCHLRDADREVNLPRFHQIVQEDSPFLPGVVTDPWAEERAYIRQSGPEAMHAFMEARSEICALLNQLTPSGWGRNARHAIFGPTTLLELVSFLVTHDIVHIRQIAQTLQADRAV